MCFQSWIKEDADTHDTCNSTHLNVHVGDAAHSVKLNVKQIITILQQLRKLQSLSCDTCAVYPLATSFQCKQLESFIVIVYSSIRFCCYHLAL